MGRPAQMAKELAKLKEEIRQEFTQLKAELQQEIKTAQASLERDARSELRELRNEQKSLTESLEFAHAEIETLKKQLTSEVEKNAKLSTEKDNAEAKCAALEQQNEELEKRVVQLEQYSRNVNLEIQGVEEEEEENIPEILTKVGIAIHESITDSDVEICHRVPTRNDGKTKNIVIQFKSRAKRDSALEKAKKTRLTNRDLGFDSSDPIYINEHLCPSLKKLLSLAKQKKKEQNWKFVWVRGGKIFARKHETSKVLRIQCEKDIGKIQ